MTRARSGAAAAGCARLAGIGRLAVAALLAVTATGAEAPVLAPAASGATESFDYGRFGTVTVYRPAGPVRAVALFLSGDGGWNLGVVGMAERLAEHGTLVAGLDVPHYLKSLQAAPESCVQPAADLENLSHYVQSKAALPAYVTPVLVGYSSGATLAYAALAEAPEGLFRGGVSLGFCPDLELVKPMCGGGGLRTTPRRDAHGVAKGVNLLPAKRLAGRWAVLQGELDEVCPAPATSRFVAAVTGADWVPLASVGHGYGVEKNWLAQYLAAFERVASASEAAPAAATAAAPAALADLPLRLVPAVHASEEPWFAVLLSGDGGWVGIDKGIAAALAAHGIPVVGWDSLEYFWSARSPEGAARDLARVLEHYASALHKPRALVIGYSQGADTLPFMVNRLPEDVRRRVGMTALLGLSDNAVFEFHVANWLGDPPKGLPTAPELAAWRGPPYLCLYGEADGDAACASLTGREGRAIKMPGGHHFGGRYSAVASAILAAMPPG